MSCLDGLITSRERTLLFPGGATERIVYAIVEAKLVRASHRPSNKQTLVRSPDFPSALQNRAYSGPRAAGVFLTIAATGVHLDPLQLLDLTAGTVLGPPVVAVRHHAQAPRDFVCVIGNHRSILATFAAERGDPGWERYQEALVETITALELPRENLEGLSHPFLVRILVQYALGSDADGLAAAPHASLGNASATAAIDSTTPSIPDQGVLAALARLNALSDASFTKARDPATLGFVYARQLRAIRATIEGHALYDGLVAHLATYDNPELFLSSADGRALMEKLLELNVISSEERSAFTRGAEGQLTALGRICILSMFYALAFDDADVYDAAPPAIRQRLQMSLGHLISCRDHGEWDLAPHVGAGCGILGRLTLTASRRWHTSVIGRRSALTAIVRVSTQLELPLAEGAQSGGAEEPKAEKSAEERARETADKRDAAYARAWAGILLCDNAQSRRALATRFALWRTATQEALRAANVGAQVELWDADLAGALRSPDEVLIEIFCRTPEVAMWVREQITPPYDARNRFPTTASGTTIAEELDEAACVRLFDEAREWWSDLEEALPPGTLAPQSGRGRRRVHTDATVFAATVVRRLALPRVSRVALGGLAVPTSRQCRRRVTEWRSDARLWASIVDWIPELQQPRRGRPRRASPT